MLLDTEKMISITKLQKELTQTIRSISDVGGEAYILKNNVMEAVLLSFDEYEYLKKIEDVFEHFEIADMIQERSKKYDPQTNISWNKLKTETYDV
ncbi:hypothetical protein AGMMS50212_04040 [Spirochaetia bacterium]|nr:hypothetical protein AGMMS50212_04040 [Spirochaetia bacterium]